MLNLSKYTVLSRYGERPYGCVAITWITNSSCVPLLPSPLPKSLCAPSFQLQWRSFGQSRCWLRQVPTDTCAATAKSRARCSAGAGAGSSAVAGAETLHRGSATCLPQSLLVSCCCGGGSTWAGDMSCFNCCLRSK